MSPCSVIPSVADEGRSPQTDPAPYPAAMAAPRTEKAEKAAGAPGPRSADGSTAASTPIGAPSSPERDARRPARRWIWPLVAVGAFIVGLGSGASSADPTASQEYRVAVAERDEARDAVGAADARATAAEARARRAQSAADGRETQLDTRESELDRREEALKEREAAVTATEQRQAANQVGDGVWTVGVDIEPGTYRTTAAVGGTCYWGIYRTGTNGDDIIQNDIVTGGFPTVTLSAGQDFKSSRCGNWNRQ